MRGLMGHKDDAPECRSRALQRNSDFLWQGAVYVTATAAPILVAATITPFVTRTLGAEGYGSVALVLTLTQLGQVILGLGLPTAITRHTLLGSNGTRGAAAQVVMVAVGATGMAGVTIVYTRVVFESMPLVAASAALTSASSAIFLSGQALLRGLGQPLRYMKRAIVYAFVPTTFGLVLTSLMDQSAKAYLFGFVGSQLAISAMSTLLLLRVHRPGRRWRDLRTGIAIGLPTVPHQMAGIAVTALLPVVVTTRWGPAEAGAVQLAVLIGSVPTIVVGALNNQWSYAVYSAKTLDERRLTIEATAGYVAAISLVATWGIALAAPLVVKWIAPSSMDHVAMLRLIILVAAASPLGVLYLANIQQVFASGRTGLLALTTPIAATASLGLAVFLVDDAPAGGFWLVGMATMAFAVLQTAMGILLRKRTGLAKLHLRRPSYVVALAVVGVWLPNCWRLSSSMTLVVFGAAAAIGVRIIRQGPRP